MEIETELVKNALEMHKKFIIKLIGKDKYKDLIILMESTDPMVYEAVVQQINNYAAGRGLELETLIKKKATEKVKKLITECLITLL